MSKVIAIMEKPKNCDYCVFGVCKYSTPLSTHRKGYYCKLKKPEERVVEDFDFKAEVHLSNCPLKEIPEKVHHENYCDAGRYDKGYNDCVDKILGGAENE